MVAMPISAEIEMNTLDRRTIARVEYELVPDREAYEEYGELPMASLPSGQRFPAIVMPDKED